MIANCRQRTVLVIGLAAYGLVCISLPGQVLTNAFTGAERRTERVQTNQGVTVPPMPASAKSPVEFFRELLEMAGPERNAALADRTPEDRNQILAKVREYRALKPDQQKLRLEATELSWYMLRLMRASPTNQAAQLEAVPPSLRKPVEDRLASWNKLSAEVRKDFLNRRLALQYLVESSAGVSQPASTNISPERAIALKKGVTEIQGMPEAQRQKLLTRFNEFFELTPGEKERALNTLSEAERLQMEKTLQSFGQLTPEQRRACLRSFEKFAGMTVTERSQFLKNAERWKLMTPDQRQAWRVVVSQAPLIPVMPDTPPVPKAAPPRRATPLVVTNVTAPLPTNGN